MGRQPVQNLSACTVQLYLYSPYWPYGLYRASVPVQYNYTSTPPVDRTACTEPQGLYSTAIPPLSLWTVQPVQSLSACTLQLYLYSTYGLLFVKVTNQILASCGMWYCVVQLAIGLLNPSLLSFELHHRNPVYVPYLL